MSSRHFIKDFSSEQGLFFVYMALVANSGDMGKPPTERQEVKYKWLMEETGFTQKKIKNCIAFLKVHEAILTEDRVDTLYYRFVSPTHQEIADKVRIIRATPNKATEHGTVHVMSRKYLQYVLEKNKDRSVSVSYCLSKMVNIIADFRRRKLSETEIEHYFISLAHKVAEGQNLEGLLRNSNQESEDGLTKVPTKVVGWSD
jgi:hypothetical protein